MAEIKRIGQRGALFTYKNPSTCNLNLYVIEGKHYNYIIDTGLGSLSAQPINEYLKDTGKQAIVINTHYHFDHIWGNDAFHDSLIISHTFCREMMRSEWEHMIHEYGYRCCGEVKMKLPDLVFDDELFFAEDEILLFHSPGHTPDSISILDQKDRILIVADNIGEDLENLVPSLSCEKKIYRSTLEKYLALDFDLCVSGHNIILEKNTIEKVLSTLEE